MRTLRAIAILAATAALLAAPLAASAAEEAGGEPSITSSGTIYNALWAVGIFAVLLAVLGKLGWKPLMAALQQREQHVSDTLRKADEREKESQALLESYRRRLEELELSAAERLRQAEHQAAALRQEILTEAQNRAEELARRAAAEVQAAKQASVEEVSSVAVDLAITAARDILGRELDEAARKRLLDQSLDRIRAEGRKALAAG